MHYGLDDESYGMAFLRPDSEQCDDWILGSVSILGTSLFELRD